jgi:hypothetical protein
VDAVDVMMHFFYYLDYPTVLPSSGTAKPSTTKAATAKSPSSVVPIELKAPNGFVSSTADGGGGSATPTLDEDDFWSEFQQKTRKKKKTLAFPDQDRELLAPSPPPLGLALHARVFALAEMHGVAGLKELALERFNHEASHHWNADEFLVAAECAYVETVEEVRQLRHAVVAVLSEHKSLLKTDLCRELLARLPSLSYDMILHLVRIAPAGLDRKHVT